LICAGAVSRNFARCKNRWQDEGQWIMFPLKRPRLDQLPILVLGIVGRSLPGISLAAKTCGRVNIAQSTFR
jgi:hypothetical protein